jgi:choline transport protein
MYALLVVALDMNTLLARSLPKIEPLFLIIHAAGSLLAMVPLIIISPSTASTREVFAVFANSGDWVERCNFLVHE